MHKHNSEWNWFNNKNVNKWRVEKTQNSISRDIFSVYFLWRTPRKIPKRLQEGEESYASGVTISDCAYSTILLYKGFTMGIFDRNRTPNKRTSDLTTEERQELAFSYASKDWHNVDNVLKDLYKEAYTEEVRDSAQEALFNYKLSLIEKKVDRSFKLPA